MHILIQDNNYLFLMIRSTGSFIKSKEAQIDVMFDIKTGSHCDDSEIGINIKQKIYLLSGIVKIAIMLKMQNN